MADSKEPDSPEDPFASGMPPAPYWAQPSEPIGPPMEQIPAEIPPHWQQPYGQQPPGQQPYGQQPYGQPAEQQWGSPPAQYGNWAGERPATYLSWAIVSTLLFCLPLGVTSIYYATRVNRRWQAGDVAGAKDASERARKFAIASAIIGAIALALIFSTGSWNDGA